MLVEGGLMEGDGEGRLRICVVKIYIFKVAGLLSR